jgi:hypothetical protein
MHEGDELFELVLTMTDRKLQKDDEEEQVRRLREQEQSVPISLAEPSAGGRERRSRLLPIAHRQPDRMPRRRDGEVHQPSQGPAFLLGVYCAIL